MLASGYADDVTGGDALPINADARLLGAALRRGDVIEYPLPPGREAYLVSIMGRADVNGVRFETWDGAAVSDEDLLTIRALDDTKIVLAELQ